MACDDNSNVFNRLEMSLNGGIREYPLLRVERISLGLNIYL